MWEKHNIEINNEKFNCKAGGILPYTIISNNIYFLFQKPHTKHKKQFYTDFGGKRETSDIDIIYTSAREFAEETNGEFFRKSIYDINEYDYIKRSTIIMDSIIRYRKPIYLYNYYGKYITYFVEVYPISVSALGNIEYKENIKRDCIWISLDEVITDNFINNNLQYRLKKGFRKTIYDIQRHINIQQNSNKKKILKKKINKLSNVHNYNRIETLI